MPTNANYRVLYACHYCAIGPEGSQSGLPVHGLQSISTSTSFSLEQVFELGQLEIYENIESLPNVEMTMTKVLDGQPLIYHLASRGATSKTLLNRSNRKSDVILSIFSDAQDSASGTPVVQAYCSGMYLSSLNYNIQVQGQSTESVTLVGNDKIWIKSSGQVWNGKTGFAFNGHFNNTDAPVGSQGTIQRQDVKMGNAAAGGSVFPTQIPGVTVTGGSGYNVLTSGYFGTHFQDITIACNLGREDLYELGQKKPYYRYANFPTAVDCTINIVAAGTQPGDMINADSNVDNLTNEPIVIRLADGTTFDLGTKNKLQTVTYSGGDSGGGVATVSYQYQNFNILNVTNPTTDPEGLS
jgi:hypothetical protein